MTHRRVLAAASTLSLSLLMLSPAPAHAEVLSGTHSVRVSVYPGTIGTTTCTLSAPRGSESSGPIAADGVAVPRTTTTSLSVTDDNDPSNVTRLQATSSSTMTASQHAGQLSRLRMSVDTSASITTSVAGGNCSADIYLMISMAALTASSPKYLRIMASNSISLRCRMQKISAAM